MKKGINLKASIERTSDSEKADLEKVVKKVIKEGKKTHPDMKVVVKGVQGEGEMAQVKLRIEGDEEAASDFAKKSMAVVKEIVKKGQESVPDDLKVRDVSEYSIDEDLDE